MRPLISIGIILCFVAASGRLFSQANAYFLHDPVWNVRLSCIASTNCIRSTRNIFYTNGDTLIKGLLYKKIFQKWEETYATGYTGSNNPPQNCTGWRWVIHQNPSFFVRSLDKKIFIRMPADTVESLLYDFNLGPGDNLPITYNQKSSGITVAAVDSISTPYGYRKRFALSGSGAPQYLVEGVGTSYGFTEYIGTILDCGHYYLDCFSLNDTTYFPANGKSCNLAVGIESHHRDVLLSVVPNPFNTTTTITFNEPLSSARLNLYNIRGQIIMTLDQISGNKIDLDRRSLEAGLYFFELIDLGMPVGTGKLVITD